MKEIDSKKLRIKAKIWVLPDTKLSQKEFVSGIQKAEEGPFFTV